MKITFSIRAARLSDCRAVERLGRVPEIAIAPGWYLPLEYYQRVVKGKHIFLIAVMNKQIIGFTIAEKIVAGYLSQYIVVSKKYRSQGIGRTLLEAMESEARRRKAYFLLAYAVTNNPYIQKLHRRLGWQSNHVTREWTKGLATRPRRGRLGAPKRKRLKP